MARQSCIPNTTSSDTPSSFLLVVMEAIQRYSYGGGALQIIRDSWVTYQRTLRNPREQQLEGFGQWEFLTLLGATLTREARDVHNSFIEGWDFENDDDENYDTALRTKRGRII